MYDPVMNALHAAALQNRAAVPLVFAAGAASGLGPCIAPRFITVAALAANRAPVAATLIGASFIAGLAAAYAAFGATGTLLLRSVQYSAAIYGVVGAALAAGGIATLFKREPSCAHAESRTHAGGAGGAFLLGVSSAMVVSPCCTPLLAAILAYSSAADAPRYGAELSAAYALGHGLPVLFAAVGSGGVMRLLQRFSVRRAAATVSGTIMIALAGYYVVMA